MTRATTYQITLQGHLDPRWSDWLDGLGITHEANGTTTLAGQLADQAALHGVLLKIRDLGVPLLSLSTVATTASPTDAD
jgi:hypothetical protein